MTPAVAVGIGAAAASVLRLPLSAIVVAVLLTSTSGAGTSPPIIVGVVVAHLATLALTPRPPKEEVPEAPAAHTAVPVEKALAGAPR